MWSLRQARVATHMEQVRVATHMEQARVATHMEQARVATHTEQVRGSVLHLVRAAAPSSCDNSVVHVVSARLQGRSCDETPEAQGHRMRRQALGFCGLPTELAQSVAVGAH